MSSLDFAVGQVQDAGLIFLCAIASGIANEWDNAGGDEAHPGKKLISTVVVGLSLSTALLGLAVVATGKLKLANYVQLLPVPVVGGYLAFIGFFCLEAGLSMMAGVEIRGLLQWPLLIHTSGALVHVLPGVALGFGILLVVKRYRNFSALAITLFSIPLAFYLLLLLSPYSLQDCRDHGWVGTETSTPAFYNMWAIYKFSEVQWNYIPRQFLQWLAMYLVVAFSSSLDVAAIELEMGSSLDYDHELVTVGWSNVASGLLGGYTGSYIFSQTILTRRAKTKSRLTGVILVLAELVFVCMPYSIVGYFPKAFFGSVLCFIGFALMTEWLWDIRSKVSVSEYGLVWLTFLSIQATNLQVPSPTYFQFIFCSFRLLFLLLVYF